ncbi:hypothetical protein VNO77_27082 [Canavalia gladiata]|uniref:Uncharacterized protein n=1 Tax=Canavalia gladiata TaxID=3824 RepID=A0AAN9KY76_CANGL
MHCLKLAIRSLTGAGVDHSHTITRDSEGATRLLVSSPTIEALHGLQTEKLLNDTKEQQSHHPLIHKQLNLLICGERINQSITKHFYGCVRPLWHIEDVLTGIKISPVIDEWTYDAMVNYLHDLCKNFRCSLATAMDDHAKPFPLTTTVKLEILQLDAMFHELLWCVPCFAKMREDERSRLHACISVVLNVVKKKCNQVKLVLDQAIETDEGKNLCRERISLRGSASSSSSQLFRRLFGWLKMETPRENSNRTSTPQELLET